MSELFNPENRFWNFVGKLADVSAMSVIWLITSLPLITVGASTAAFYDFCLKAVRDQEGGVIRGYFCAWKRHFRKATILWMVQLAGLLFFIADIWFVAAFWAAGSGSGADRAALTGMSAAGGQVGLALTVFLAVMADLFLVITMYMYGILSVFDHPVGKILRDAPAMAMKCLPATAAMMILPAAFILLFYQLSGFFFFWVGGVILASSYLMNYVFVKVSV
ncbi:YesL family protein [[Clostridium] aminophilum]|uniref:YesL family protein n=1 Tax=[Clostridium] aminophilum TaxID=1526 RepID=UPI0033305830